MAILTTRVLTVVATPDLSGVAGERFASTPKTRAWQTVNGPARALLSPYETGAEQFRSVSADRDSPFNRSALATRASSAQQGPRVLLPAHHLAGAHSVGEVLVRGRTHPHRRPASPGLLDTGDRAQARPRPVHDQPRTAPQRRPVTGSYRPFTAHRRALGRRPRPRPGKLAADLELRTMVQQLLDRWWSPEQISQELRCRFPGQPERHLVPETIYQAIYVQGRGGLRRELHRALRTGRAMRRPRRGSNAMPTGTIPGMVMISERPAEVADRAVPGHWEGDLVMGRNNQSAVGTLVERTSRYMLLFHLPHGHDAAAVDAAMRKAITKLPGQFFRTITWDQGREMARHGAFSLATDIAVYFCD